LRLSFHIEVEISVPRIAATLHAKSHSVTIQTFATSPEIAFALGNSQGAVWRLRSDSFGRSKEKPSSG
jgi:hypothetical protein